MATINSMLITSKDRRRRDERRHNPVNVFASPRLDIHALFGHEFRGVPFEGKVAMGDLMTFAYPLYDESTDFEEFQITLHFAELCWNFALAAADQRSLILSELRQRVRGTAEQIESVVALVQGMGIRHRELFPTLHGGTTSGVSGATAAFGSGTRRM
ncbi:MAG: hypothetical protein HZA54_04380 [Planctomycetes bacterium]|nr:hypothetical protein [Planctomycetota bacterium]